MNSTHTNKAQWMLWNLWIIHFYYLKSHFVHNILQENINWRFTGAYPEFSDGCAAIFGYTPVVTYDIQNFHDFHYMWNASSLLYTTNSLAKILISFPYVHWHTNTPHLNKISPLYIWCLAKLHVSPNISTYTKFIIKYLLQYFQNGTHTHSVLQCESMEGRNALTILSKAFWWSNKCMKWAYFLEVCISKYPWQHWAYIDLISICCHWQHLDIIPMSIQLICYFDVRMVRLAWWWCLIIALLSLPPQVQDLTSGLPIHSVSLYW